MVEGTLPGASMRVFSILFIFLALVVPTAVAQADIPADIAALRARAEAGDVRAQIALARAYREGAGVAQSDVQAFDWYMKAAQAGYPEAENEVAYTYRSEKNFSESMKWYGLAARQGSGNAMFNLGTLYYNGDGVPVDDVQAYAWFWLASHAGSKPGIEAIARSESQIRPAQIVDGKMLAASMLAEGSKVPRDAQAAISLYDEIGNGDKPAVQLQLAKIYMNGWGVPLDGAKADTYCHNALKVAKDYVPAMLCLGFLNQSTILGAGRGKEAFNWYEKAFKAGDPIAAYGLGVAYVTGNGAKLDYEKGYRYLMLAAIGKIGIAVPLAKQVEQRLSPEVAKRIAKKVLQDRFLVHEFGKLDKELFPYAVKVDHLP
jgi:TPR repeat protein